MKLFSFLFLFLNCCANGQQYGVFSSSESVTTYVLLDGVKLRTVKIGLKIKAEIPGHKEKFLRELWLEVDGKRSVVPKSFLESKNIDVSLKTMSVGKDAPSDESFDFFIDFSLRDGATAAFFIFLFKDGKFIALESDSPKGEKMSTLGAGGSEGGD